MALFTFCRTLTNMDLGIGGGQGKGVDKQLGGGVDTLFTSLNLMYSIVELSFFL